MFVRKRSIAGVLVLGALALIAAILTAQYGPSASSAAAPKAAAKVNIVAGENEYGNVAQQIGGQYVSVYSVESNPNTDPHTYEVSPGVAKAVAGAKIVIQNGVGYDTFLNKIESASHSSSRKVIDVQQLRGLPDNTPNPHLWYDPKTMPAVAKALVTDLSAIDPAHKAAFHADESKFIASLKPWMNAIAAFKAKHKGAPAATTEPVADYLLTAMGINNLTPFRFQAAIMNGTDPTPQDVALEKGFFTKHKVKVFCYNQQVTDTLTASIRQTALKNKVPIVGVYETMPTPGYTYQSWMLAEVHAIQNAIEHGKSTEHL
jgi:zinc/manganese transport system substrate-binding protein